MNLSDELYEDICSAIDDSELDNEKIEDAYNCFTCTGTCENSCSGTCNNTCNATCTENCRSGFGGSRNDDTPSSSGWF